MMNSGESSTNFAIEQYSFFLPFSFVCISTHIDLLFYVLFKNKIVKNQKEI